MKLILCGYNWAGCRVLDLLLEKNFEVFIFTHKAPPYVPSLAEYAKSKKISYTYEKISIDNLPFKPDCILSIYYNYLIGEEVLEKANYKAINLHPSYLPSYRGCSSITWAIFNNESELGFTYHYISKGFDEGNIILQKKISIFLYETQSNIYQRIMFKALENFNKAFELFLAGYKGVKQSGKSSYYKRGAPQNGEIKKNWSRGKIKRFIRAMINPPMPYAKYKGKEIKSYDDYLKLKK